MITPQEMDLVLSVVKRMREMPFYAEEINAVMKCIYTIRKEDIDYER
jgi:hypothetical protein